MRFVYSVLIVVSLNLLLSSHLSAQANHQSVALADDAGARTGNNSLKPLRIKTADEEYLETLFAPSDIPRAGIPVLENALGDVVYDSLVDVRDLLRMRDIVAGRGPAATVYEQGEGDLDGNSGVDSLDVAYLRDVLLQKKGLPHVIDASGGEVVGNGGRTIFSIPGATFSVPTRISAGNFSATDFSDVFGGSLGDFAPNLSYMTGATLTAEDVTVNDSAWFSKVSMFEAVPPSTQLDSTGTNFAFGLSPDANGDGFPDLVLRGPLVPVYDSMQLIHMIPSLKLFSNQFAGRKSSSSIATLVGMALPGLMPIELTGFSKVTIDYPGPYLVADSNQTIYPGNYIELWGKNWQTNIMADYDVMWINGNGSIMHGAMLLDTPDDTQPALAKGIAVAVPLLSPGSYNVQIIDRQHGLFSNSLTLIVNGLNAGLIPGAKDSMVSILDIEMANVQSLINDIGYSSSFPERMQDLNGLYMRLDSDRLRLVNTSEDSLNLTALSLCAEFGRNLRSGIIGVPGIDDILFSFSRESSTRHVSSDCPDPKICRHLCKHDEKPDVIWDMNCYWKAVECWGNPYCDFDPVECAEDCKTFRDANRDNEIRCQALCCWQLIGGQDVLIKEGMGMKVDKKTMICIHQCCPPLTGSAIGPAPTPSPHVLRHTQGSLNHSFTPASGIIVSVNNSPTPISVGYTNSAGEFMIPVNILTGQITFSTYDPHTGFFDPNAGSVSVTDPTGREFVVIRHVPDTTRIRRTLHIPGYVDGVINSTTPGYQYLMFVPSDLVGKPLNVGLRAQQPLTFWLQDPSWQQNPGSGFVIRDSSTDCGFERTFVPTQSGTYLITVTYGVSGGQGPFTVGINYAPCPSSPFLCGTMQQDTLYSNCFPEYDVTSGTTVPLNDTLTVTGGTTIEFEHGGSISTGGVVQGKATHTNPIVLKPVGGAILSRSLSTQSTKPKSQVVDGRKQK